MKTLLPDLAAALADHLGGYRPWLWAVAQRLSAGACGVYRSVYGGAGLAMALTTKDVGETDTPVTGLS